MADDRRERALRALALSRRHHLPVSVTALKVGLDPAEVLKFTAEAFERAGDDWFALPRDRILREMQVLTESGPEWIETHDSHLASRLGQHDNDIKFYLERGDPSRLKPLVLRAGSRTIRLASDPQTIDRLAEGGEIHMEVYRR